jgi:hypothetical protein
MTGALSFIKKKRSKQLHPKVYKRLRPGTNPVPTAAPTNKTEINRQQPQRQPPKWQNTRTEQKQTPCYPREGC